MPPAPFSETKSQRDRRLTQSLTRIDDYEAFRRSTRDEREGPIPGIHLTNDDQRELLDLIAFFDLMPFAYRRSAPSEGYIAVDFARTAFTPSKNFGYLQERYAPQLLRMRSRLRRVPMLRHAAQGIAQSFRIPANDLELCFATPRPLMAYLRWKAFTTCKAARLDPKQVARCEGRLVRSGARWVLRVDRIVLKDGRALTWRGA